MYLIYGLYRLNFDDNNIFDEQVCDKIPNGNVLVENFHLMLLDNFETGIAQFNDQCVLVNFLYESHAECIADLMNATDNSFGYLIEIQSAFIGVHRRFQRISRSSRPTL